MIKLPEIHKIGMFAPLKSPFRLFKNAGLKSQQFFGEYFNSPSPARSPGFGIGRSKT